jgi:hypothetical protein
MTQTVTTGEGRAYVFIAVDHCSGELVETHASSSASRWEALELIRQGVAKQFGTVKENIAAGLILRHDNGSNYLADDFQDEIEFLGIECLPAFVRQPEGNGVAERVIETLKEQLLWVRYLPTVEALRKGFAEFADIYNASLLRERHGHKTPNQIRAELKVLASEAATEFKLAALPAQRMTASSSRCSSCVMRSGGVQPGTASCMSVKTFRDGRVSHDNQHKR